VVVVGTLRVAHVHLLDHLVGKAARSALKIA
jgi:hypothetical protein